MKLFSPRPLCEEDGQDIVSRGPTYLSYLACPTDPTVRAVIQQELATAVAAIRQAQPSQLDAVQQELPTAAAQPIVSTVALSLRYAHDKTSFTSVI